jgi:hypothetical protein
MAIVKKVEEKRKVSLSDTIRYQIITYCFFNQVQISNSDLECLTALAKCGDINLSKFCKLMETEDVFKSAQSARNAVTKAYKKNLIVKNVDDKKTISVNADLNIQTSGLVLLDFKILGSEPEKLQEV